MFEPLLEDSPPSSEFARFGAERIRNLAKAVDDRFRSIFVDSDADPLVLKPLTVGTTQLSDNAVTLAKMSDNSVGTTELVNVSVTEPKLADDSVSTRTIVDAAVVTNALADDAVTGAKVADATLEIVHLTADARSKLTKRVLIGTFAFGISTAIAAGDSIIRQSSVATLAGGNITAIASWYNSPVLANITDSLIFKGIALTPILYNVGGVTQYGVAIHNVSLASIDLNGYTVAIYALVDP